MSNDKTVNPFWTTSVEDITVNTWTEFYKLEVWTHELRFLAGPFMFYISQEWNEETKKYVWDKKFYSEEDTKAKTDSNAKLCLSYIIYDAETKTVKQWDITQKWVLKALKAISKRTPDLSKVIIDLTVTKGSNNINEFQLIPAPADPFTNEDVIKQFQEANPFNKMKKGIEAKIDETKNWSSLDKEEQDIQNEIEMNKAMWGWEEKKEVKKTSGEELDDALKDTTKKEDPVSEVKKVETPAPVDPSPEVKKEDPAPEVKKEVTNDDVKDTFK